MVSLTFPDGNSRDYDAGVTPAEVAASIASSLAKKVTQRATSSGSPRRPTGYCACIRAD